METSLKPPGNQEPKSAHNALLRTSIKASLPCKPFCLNRPKDEHAMQAEFICSLDKIQSSNEKRSTIDTRRLSYVGGIHGALITFCASPIYPADKAESNEAVSHITARTGKVVVGMTTLGAVCISPYYYHVSLGVHEDNRESRPYVDMQSD